MRYQVLAGLTLAAAIVAVAPASASERVLTLDPAASEVAFDLGATGHDVHGVLALRSGEIRFDPETGAASGRLVIDAGSAETGNRKRDKTMHNKVLLSGEFPSFVFHPRSIEGPVALEGESDFTIHGVLEMLGKEHPLDLVTTAQIHGDQVSATTQFRVPYVAWGLHDPSMFILRVAKEVEVKVNTGGTLGPTGAIAAGAAR